MTPSRSDKDNAVEKNVAGSANAPHEQPASHSPYQSMEHSGVLFQNAVANQQQQNSLSQAATNLGVMQIYSLDTSGGAATDTHTVLYLASPRTGQCVELASTGPSGIRGSRQPRALALFCHAHAGDRLETMSGEQRASPVHAPGEFTKWLDDDAVQRYRALTGFEPPPYA